VEGAAAGFRPGEWLDVRVIATARVPIITVTAGGSPFLADDASDSAGNGAADADDHAADTGAADGGGDVVAMAVAMTAAAADAAVAAAAAAVVEHECDICIEHALVQRNTLLLRTYAAVDPRARQLLLAVKVWAKRAGVADASNGTLSSYAWALLGVHYLQLVRVLPNLQSPALVGAEWQCELPLAETEGCDTSFCEDVEQARGSLLVAADAAGAGVNAQSVGELLLGFFHHCPGPPRAFKRPQRSPQ
jgi:DNA polymerase sigma